MSSAVTELLRRAREGDRAALDELLPSVYDELHHLAFRQLSRERADHTLQPTALVNEAYIRLFGDQPPDFRDRRHFIGIAARVMRQVLVDYARTRSAHKRSAILVPIDEERDTPTGPAIELMLIDAALERLGREDERLVRLIEMHYFGGMTAEEIAVAGTESVHVIRHDLRYAQAWLRRDLMRPKGPRLREQSNR